MAEVAILDHLKEREAIVCRPSLYYFRRMAMLMALAAGLGLLFLYDGLIGYPVKNHLADLHEVFEPRPVRGPLEVVPEQPERTQARESELTATRDAALAGTSWATYAAARGLGDGEPKRYRPDQIEEQFFFALLMAAVTAGLALFWLSRRNRIFQANDTALVFPNGREVPFAEILEIDLGKWDRGMARLRYSGKKGEERIAKVDDYHYTGTTALLKRALEKNPEIALIGDPRWLDRADPPQVKG